MQEPSPAAALPIWLPLCHSFPAHSTSLEESEALLVFSSSNRSISKWMAYLAFLISTQNLLEMFFSHLLYQHLNLEVSIHYEVLRCYFLSPWTP